MSSYMEIMKKMAAKADKPVVKEASMSEKVHERILMKRAAKMTPTYQKVMAKAAAKMGARLAAPEVSKTAGIMSSAINAARNTGKGIASAAGKIPAPAKKFITNPLVVGSGGVAAGTALGNRLGGDKAEKRIGAGLDHLGTWDYLKAMLSRMFGGKGITTDDLKAKS